MLAITGASGAPYALRLLEMLLRDWTDGAAVDRPRGEGSAQDRGADRNVDLNAFRLTDLLPNAFRLLEQNFHYDHFQNLYAPIASGSSPTAGMVICPAPAGR